MDNFNIIMFVCNWGPHAAFQALQDAGSDIPPQVRMVRIPCTGRISKSLLFKAFEMGADGVALVGCEPGSCRYGTGTASAEFNVDDTRGILELLGLNQTRLRWATFLPEQSGELLGFLQDFQQDLRAIGRNPVHLAAKADVPRQVLVRGSEYGSVAGADSASARKDLTRSAGPPTLPTESTDSGSARSDVTRQLMASHDVYACQDCGKCSSACPLTLSGKSFSPRAMANAIIAGASDSPAVAEDVWSCLTCGLCYDRCPSAVDFPEFIRDFRNVLRAEGKPGSEAHGGFFQSLMRTMAAPAVKTRRWRDLPQDIQVDPHSKVLFFGGCAPYFDIFFRHHLGVNTRAILFDSLRLLNFFDIHPALMAEERCCGHDLLWSGDRENYIRLARLNVDAMQSLGIEEVVTACPECHRTLAHDYPQQGIEVGFKVTHIYDLLEREIDKGAVGFNKLHRKVTFQDPCRLSRLEDRADLPRKLLHRLQPKGFEEMRDRGRSALCCGNCAWVGCDTYSKALQVKRLRQAHETGSDLLITACPKCQIHLRCAMEDPFLGKELAMEMMDLTSVMAKTIRWE
jgi:Fe-S oxidoreductase/coenzyme F420-reducing hydrogenase delta subunit